jgi:hypothetical protein
MPSVPADPFDGKPMRYRKLAKGYVVYSVGPDMKDEGGDESYYEVPYNGLSFGAIILGSSLPRDITFIVER